MSITNVQHWVPLLRLLTALKSM